MLLLRFLPLALLSVLVAASDWVDHVNEAMAEEEEEDEGDALSDEGLLGAKANQACSAADWVQRDGTLAELLEQRELSFIFVGGKGGVGKTTTSSALAIALAQRRRAAGDTRDVLLLSTDPAHSLGDAFRQYDFAGGGATKVRGVPGLTVMEVDPSVLLARETRSWAKIVRKAGHGAVAAELGKFQSWLTSIPGIDEATALASVVSELERGTYSTIVFDTAPTGHTLKLLALPAVLGTAIAQLQSWSGKAFSYYQMLTGLFRKKGEPDPAVLKRKLEKKLRKYQKGIAKVSAMLKDNARTTFVTVCIAEHLSVSETRRLLAELARHKVHTNHVVVNQLVRGSPTADELVRGVDGAGLAAALSAAPGVSPQLAEKLVASARLSSAREAIQANHLRVLAKSQEAACLDIVELPLMPGEVTGPQALTRFAELLHKKEQPKGGVAPRKGVAAASKEKEEL